MGAGENTVGFYSLKNATINETSLKVVLESKENLRASIKLLQIIKDYFETRSKALEFRSTLTNCINQARKGQLLLDFATREERELTQAEYTQIMSKLRRFLDFQNPFGDQFFHHLQALYSLHLKLQQNVQSKKREFDKKLKTQIKDRMKISSSKLKATYTTILFCRVSAVSVVRPALANSMSTVSHIPFKYFADWICKPEMMASRDAIDEMANDLYVMVKKLETIRVLVENLEIKHRSVLTAAQFANESRDWVTLRIALEHITKQQAYFNQVLEQLDVHSRR